MTLTVFIIIYLSTLLYLEIAEKSNETFFKNYISMKLCRLLNQKCSKDVFGNNKCIEMTSFSHTIKLL
jgi:hypothetical protein